MTKRGTPRVVAAAEPQDAPSQADGSGTLAVATWNIRSGRNLGLESALRAMASMAVDICLLTETKLTDRIYTRKSSGYEVVATNAVSKSQGGVALCWRSSESYEVEETRECGPNVITFELVTGEDRFYVVGCYIPPSDRVTLEQVRSAWANCPKGCIPMLLGDLNVNLESPRDERDEEIAEECGFRGLTDMSQHFAQRHRRLMQGRWTWRMVRRGRVISSRPDYFLAREKDRCRFQNVAFRMPRHHDSDHRAIVATLYARGPRKLKQYRRRRSRFPVRLQRWGPRTEMETMFEVLQTSVEAPVARESRKNNWISKATWELVDNRARLRKMGLLVQRSLRGHNRRVQASLKADRAQRATDVADNIQLQLSEGNLKEAWHFLQGWYRDAEDRPPKPCHNTMDAQTIEREKLYAKVEPPGEPIPINVEPFAINDATPTEAEIRAVVKGLKNGRAGGVSGIKAEHINNG